MALFDFLPGESRIVSIIRSAVANNEAIDFVHSAIEEAGITVRSELVSNVYEYYSETVKTAQEYVQSLEPNARPVIANLPKNITTQLHNFTYNVQVKGNFVGTSTETTRWVSVSTSALLTPAEAAQGAVSIVEAGKLGGRQGYGLDVTDATVTEIYQNSAGLFGEGAAEDLSQVYGFGHGIF